MPGRRMLSDADSLDPSYAHPDMVRRRTVLHETLERFSAPNHFMWVAMSNLERWREAAAKPAECGSGFVVSGDWGEVTGDLIRRYGSCFAALNMANAFVPGGAYVEGSPAQEENMFRRTNCHFSVTEDQFNPATELYHPDVTALLSAKHGRVYLDTDKPRICIRGPEDRSQTDLGYRWLPEEEIFPFYELRAAAQDLRDGTEFSESNARERVAAQLDTLIEQKVQHAVLGASGCGAFLNPSLKIAELYKQEIQARSTKFKVIAFAIYQAGYGPDNLTPFLEVFDKEFKLG